MGTRNRKRIKKEKQKDAVKTQQNPKRKEKRRFQLEPGTGIVILAIMMVVCIFTVALFPKTYAEEILLHTVGLALIGVVFYLDNSGFRLRIMKGLPDSMPFYQSLSKERTIEDTQIECYKSLSWISIILYVYSFRWDIQFLKGILGGCCIVFSALAIIRYLKNPEKIHFTDFQGDLFSTIVQTIVPAAGILAYMDYNTYNRWSVFSSILLAGLILFFLIYFLLKTTEWKSSKISGVIFSVIVIAFISSAFVTINRDFDYFPPKEYKTQILEKTYEYSFLGSWTSRYDYYITVAPWEGESEPVEFLVYDSTYRNSTETEEVTILEHRGALGIKRYEIKPKADE